MPKKICDEGCRPESESGDDLPKVKAAELGDDRNNVRSVTLSEEDIDTLYVKLPGHPEEAIPGCVKKMIRLDALLSDYDLPMVNLDFDENKKLIGIEVIV